MEIERIRRDYRAAGLRRKDLHGNPLKQFVSWLESACESSIQDPTAMVLATVSPTGQPSQRIVLLKHYDEKGFVFYTNYGSTKASDIESQPQVSLLFPWHQLDRQVQIHGIASKVSREESAAYFVSRPLESQLAAWASRQSSSIRSREFLLAQFEAMKSRFADDEVPLPDYWGGFRVAPGSYEFWQGGNQRLHDRFVYKCKEEDAVEWEIERLAP